MPSNITTNQVKELEESSAIFVQVIMNSIPATDRWLVEIMEATSNDDICTCIMNYIKKGWQVSMLLKPYWTHRGDITWEEGLLMYERWIIVPQSIRLQRIDKIHSCHQGITRCRQRSRQSIWWPGLSKQIKNTMDNCETRTRLRHQPAEPLLATKLPPRPWYTLASDLFELNSQIYIVVIDYFSKYVEFI